MTADVHDLDEYRAETDRLVEKHLDVLGFGPRDMARRREQGEQAQMIRWGKTGLDLLSIDEDQEDREHRENYTGDEPDLSFIDNL